jgi:hypothetical protein
LGGGVLFFLLFGDDELIFECIVFGILNVSLSLLDLELVD